MVQVVEPLPSTRETWNEFLAAGFGLAQPQLLWASGEGLSGWESLSHFHSSSLTLPLVISMPKPSGQNSAENPGFMSEGGRYWPLPHGAPILLDAEL